METIIIISLYKNIKITKQHDDSTFPHLWLCHPQPHTTKYQSSRKTQLPQASPSTAYSLLNIKINIKQTNQHPRIIKKNRTHFIKHLVGMTMKTCIPTVLIPDQHLPTRTKWPIFRKCPNTQGRTPRTWNKHPQKPVHKNTQMGEEKQWNQPNIQKCRRKIPPLSQRTRGLEEGLIWASTK